MFKIKDLPPIGCNPDDSPPQMTPAQRKQANTLIRQECSYHDCGHCLYLDSGEHVACVQSISFSVLCKFFRHVLLESKEGAALKAEVFQKDALRKCAVCNAAFSSTSNSAKYCRDCAADVQRKQKAAYARKRRSSVEK